MLQTKPFDPGNDIVRRIMIVCRFLPFMQKLNKAFPFVKSSIFLIL